MFTLVSLTMKDFLSFSFAQVDFRRPGVYFISGFDVKGGDSNGAGKTAIISAICYALFGRTPKGVKGSDVERWGTSGKTEIVLVLKDADGKSYEIQRKPSTVNVVIDGVPLKGGKKDMQDVIDVLFKTDFELFNSINVFTKGQMDFFAEAGDAIRKKLFKSVLQLDKLDIAAERARKILGELTTRAEDITRNIAYTREMLQQKQKNLITLQYTLEQQSQAVDLSVEQLEKDKELYKPRGTKDIQEKVQTLEKEKAGIAELSAIDEEISYCDIKYTNCTAVIMADGMRIKELDEKVKSANLLGAKCPLCGGDVKNKTLAAHRKELYGEIASYQDRVDKAEADKNELLKQIGRLNEQRRRVESIDREIESLKEEEYRAGREAEKYAEMCKDIDRKIEELRAQNHISKLENLITETKKDMEELSVVNETRESELKIVTREIDNMNYMKWLFSRHGVVSFIVEKAFARLQYLTNRHLRQIAHSGMQIVLSPQRTLKTGDVREEIELIVRMGAKKVTWGALSAGQQQRINIAMLVALYLWSREIGSNMFDFIMLDEVLDLSLAQRGQDDVADFVFSLRKLIHTIILVSHKENLARGYDHEIKVHRGEDEISKII